MAMREGIGWICLLIGACSAVAGLAPPPTPARSFGWPALLSAGGGALAVVGVAVLSWRRR